jgi:hypothetical protein
LVGVAELGCAVGEGLTLGVLVGQDEGMLLGWLLLGCILVGCDVTVSEETAAVGAAVGLGIFRFFGHDCVNDGEDTNWFTSGCSALFDQAVLVTAVINWDD